jgi:hypothetical protein
MPAKLSMKMLEAIPAMVAWTAMTAMEANGAKPAIPALLLTLAREALLGSPSMPALEAVVVSGGCYRRGDLHQRGTVYRTATGPQGVNPTLS